MSCYQVDPEHINVLIFAAENYNGGLGFSFYHPTPGGEQPYRYYQLCQDKAEIARALWGTNREAVAARYGEDDEMVPTEPYTYRTPKYTYWPVVDVLKALAGYEYQACEAPDWETSVAKAFCDTLQNTLIYHLDGYSDAAWHITENTVPSHLAQAQAA